MTMNYDPTKLYVLETLLNACRVNQGYDFIKRTAVVTRIPVDDILKGQLSYDI